MSAKPPTPQAISALLKRAGFKKSERLGPTGSSTGYRVTGTPGSGIVAVKHHFWSMRGGDPQSFLAEYAKAITDAGYAVSAGARSLIVTAREADQ